MEEIIYTHLPMEYKKGETKIIGNGKIGDYEYKIKNVRGSHPTAYIKLKKSHPFYEMSYDDIDIGVHGCLTYSEMEDDGYWIGWDYAHCDDYMTECNNGKKWTTDEILDHCRDVVKQLIEQEQNTKGVKMELKEEVFIGTKTIFEVTDADGNKSIEIMGAIEIRDLLPYSSGERLAYLTQLYNREIYVDDDCMYRVIVGFPLISSLMLETAQDIEDAIEEYPDAEEDYWNDYLRLMDQDRTYTVEITEVLQKQIKVKASSQEQARELAKELYHNGDEILIAEDLKETDFEVIKGE